MMEHNTSINIKVLRDLIEIEAFYYRDFTATADADVVDLIDFLVAYISVSNEDLPDISLSVQMDSQILVKNLTLIEDDIKQCSLPIMKGSISIVSELAEAALTRAKDTMSEQSTPGEIEGEAFTAIATKLKAIEDLKNRILLEHGNEIVEPLTMGLQ